MKKNLFTRIFAVVLAICTIFVFFACGRTPNENESGNGNSTTNQHKEHNYVESIVAPTCMAQGYTLHTCSCGDNYKDNYVEALGHVFTTYNSNHDATCLTDGTKTAKCERCGSPETVADSGTAFGHSYSDKWSVNEIAHWHSATCEHEEEKAGYGVHDMSEWRMTNEPTRTAEGVRVKTCASCGYTEEQKINKINYDYTEGLYYELNSDRTGYVVKGAYDADDSSIKVSTSAAATIAPHCLYKGLPVVGIQGFYYSTTADPKIYDYIKKVIIPETVTSVHMNFSAEEGFMWTLPNLAAIEVSENNQYYSVQDGVLYNKDKSILVCYPSGKTATAFSVPSTVKEIGISGIYRCPSLNKLTLPNGLEKLNDGSIFGGSLVSVNIPDSLKYVTSASGFPSSMETLYKNALYIGDSRNPYLILSNSRWLNVTVEEIHPNTKIIAASALGGAPGVGENFVIPDSVKIICDKAFNTTWANSIINIGSGVEEIGEEVFASTGSRGVKAINVSSNNPYFSSEDGVLYNKDKTELICYPPRKADVSEFTFPATVKEIWTRAFSGNKALKSISMSDSVESIGQYAFDGSIASINMPKNLKHIGIGAFRSCSSLTSISLPKSLISIGDNAFRNCSGLTSVTIDNGIIRVGSGAFEDCNNLKAVYITDLAAWCSSSFADLYANPCQYAQKLYLNNELVTELVIPDGVTKIADYAFVYCVEITSFTMPNSIVSIGNCAFRACLGLTDITIPHGTSSIGNSAFLACNITSITIPKSVTSIGIGAFRLCGSLTNIAYEGTVEQWWEIKKEVRWNDSTGNYVLHCTDGELSKSES